MDIGPCARLELARRRIQSSSVQVYCGRWTIDAVPGGISAAKAIGSAFSIGRRRLGWTSNLYRAPAPDARHEACPHAARPELGHHGVPAVPPVEVADHAHLAGARRPDRERGAGSPVDRR